MNFHIKTLLFIAALSFFFILGTIVGLVLINYFKNN